MQRRLFIALAALTMAAASFLAFWGQKDIADSVLKRPKYFNKFCTYNNLIKKTIHSGMFILKFT
jgi:hypothetical protein